MNLFEKIQAVAGEVMSIEKDLEVGTGNYKYKAVSDLSVTKKVKEAEIKHKLISIPMKQELVHNEVIKAAGKEVEKITYSFIIKLTTKFIDLEKPADFIEVESFGHGLDSGDKGFGKASTYARKYALLNAYKIATGEDPDQEKSEQQTSLKNDEIKNIVIDFMMKDTDYLQEILRHFNVGEMNELDDKQIKTIYSSLKKRSKI